MIREARRGATGFRAVRLLAMLCLGAAGSGCTLGTATTSAADAGSRGRGASGDTVEPAKGRETAEHDVPTWTDMVGHLERGESERFVARFPAFAEGCPDPRDLEIPILNLPGAVFLASRDASGSGTAASAASLMEAARTALGTVVHRFPGSSVAADAGYASAVLEWQSGHREEALSACERLIVDSPGTLAAARARDLLWRKRSVAPGCRWPVPPWLDSRGGRVDPADGAAPVTAVYFWSGQCPGCAPLIAQLRDIADGAGDRLRLIGVNCQGTAAEFQAALQESRPPGAQVRLADQTEDAIVPVAGTPLLVLLDRSGRVHAVEATAADLRRILE